MNQNSPFYAFKYMFFDNKFWNKFAIFFILIMSSMLPQFLPQSADKVGLFNYLTMFIVFMTVALCGQILYYGYYCSCVKSLIEQNGNYILPNFNLQKDGMLGLKCFAGQLLLGMAVVAISLMLGIILGIIGAVIYASNNIVGGIIVSIVFIVILLAIIVLSFLYYPSAIRLFAETQDPLAFFYLKKIISQIKESGDTYYKYIGIMVLVTLMIVSVAIMCCIPSMILIKNTMAAMTFLCLAIGIAAAYANFVCAYSIAKCIK